MECCKDNAGNMCSPFGFLYGEMVEAISNDVLGVTLEVNEDQLTDAFRESFGLKYLENFQKRLWPRSVTVRLCRFVISCQDMIKVRVGQ